MALHVLFAGAGVRCACPGILLKGGRRCLKKELTPEGDLFLKRMTTDKSVRNSRWLEVYACLETYVGE